MLNNTAPMLRAALAEDTIDEMDYEGFREICMGVHAIKDYARRVANKAVALREDGTKYTIPEKVDALSKRIWDGKSAGWGVRIKPPLSVCREMIREISALSDLHSDPHS